MSPYRGWAVPVVLLALVVAGCLQDLGGSKSSSEPVLGPRRGVSEKALIPEGWAERALAAGANHNHRSTEHHLGRSTANFQVVGWDPLATDYHGKTAGGYLCGDLVENDGRRLSVVHSWLSDVAFIISDVTDPAKPQKLGELVTANTHVYDLALAKDQRTVLLATSPGTNSIGNDPGGDPVTPIAIFRDACTGQERPVPIAVGPEQSLPFASGVVLVDVTNPRNPAIVDFRPFPVTGGHSVHTENLGGRTLVIVSVINMQASYYAIAEIQEQPGGRRLVPLSIYADLRPTDGPSGIPGNLHDGFLQKHPITGHNLAYLAYGVNSLVIIDIDDPGNPRYVGRWNDWKVFGEAAPPVPFVHEALPLPETWDGRHYTFIGEECGARRPATPTCLVVLLDTTEPSKPRFVGGWTIPVDVQWPDTLIYTLHYVGVEGRTFFATNYHGGLWAVDVSTPEARATMPSIGVFVPDRIPPKGTVYPNQRYHYTPGVLDVLPTSDGHLVVYDINSGLYVVRFDASNPAPPPAPWPLVKPS